MTQHSHIVKQSHCETVQVIILFDSNKVLDFFFLSTRFVQAPFYYPNMSLWVSYLNSWRDVKQSTDSHWNRPWTVSQSQYIQRQSEFWPIWGPKMAHKFDLLGPIFYMHTYNSGSNDLINKVSSESSGNFSRKLLAEDSRKSRNSIWQEVVAEATLGKPEQKWSAWTAWRWV